MSGKDKGLIPEDWEERQKMVEQLLKYYYGHSGAEKYGYMVKEEGVASPPPSVYLLVMNYDKRYKGRRAVLIEGTIPDPKQEELFPVKVSLYDVIDMKFNDVCYNVLKDSKPASSKDLDPTNPVESLRKAFEEFDRVICTV